MLPEAAISMHVNTKYDTLFWARYLQREVTLYQREWNVQIGAAFNNYLQTSTYQTLQWAIGMMGDLLQEGSTTGQLEVKQKTQLSQQ